MTGRARVDAGAPRRVSNATRKFVMESEATAAATTGAMAAILADAKSALGKRERELSDAQQRLIQSKAALAACRSHPRANCSSQAQRVESDVAVVRRHESRVRVAHDVVSDIGKQLAKAETARRRLLATQRQLAESAERALSKAAAEIDTYLAGSPHATLVQSAITSGAIAAEVAVTATGLGHLVHNVTQGHLLDTGQSESIAQMEQQDVSDQQELWKEAKLDEYKKESEHMGSRPLDY